MPPTSCCRRLASSTAAPIFWRSLTNRSIVPATPPGRLETVRNRLQAMLQAVETVQPALTGFYVALNDDQRAWFNTIGAKLFSQNR